MEIKKIKYKDLSWQLKVGVVGGWTILTVYVLSLLVGLISSLITLK